MKDKEFVVAVDIGSPTKGRFGWTSTNGMSGNGAEELLDNLRNKTYFSLGIEAPLFVPTIGPLNDFTKGRRFDERHPWSAGAGACTTTITLGFLARFFKPFALNGIAITTDIEVWRCQKDNCILIWEAFITGSSRNKNQNTSHIGDAKTALNNYCDTNNSYRLTIDLEQYLPIPLAVALQLGMSFSTETKTGLVVTGDIK